MNARIVLAYAGGLQTSGAVSWLAETHGAEVVTLTLDVGQGRDLEEVRDRARAAGAVRAHVLDVREEFARDFVLPALQAGALHQGRDPMAAALAWPLIAKKLLEIASIEQATAIAHGCIGIDRERMEASARALNPRVRVIAAVLADDPPPGGPANLWGRACAIAKAQSPRPKAQPPASIDIAFERGVPAEINGIPMVLTELIESLSTIAGQHGVAAAAVLHAAHAALEASVVPLEVTRFKPDKAAAYADLVGRGSWFTAAREAMDAANAVVQAHVTGSVRITLLKGTLRTSAAAAFDLAGVPRP